MKIDRETVKEKMGMRKKKLFHLLHSQYLLLTLFWSVIVIFMLITLSWFSAERNMINNNPRIRQILDHELSQRDADRQSLYRELVSLVHYPLISLALMDFSFFSSKPKVVSDWESIWNQKMLSIDTAYSYLFITTTVAFLGLVLYGVLNIQLWKHKKFMTKHNLMGTDLPRYGIFRTKMYLNMVVNLTILFSFFNFLTTLVSLAYGMVLLVTSFINRYTLKVKNSAFLSGRWWESGLFSLFLGVILTINIYNLFKALFLSKFGVNIDLIVQIVFPIGTITVVVTLFIRNFLSSKVNNIKKAVKEIGKRASRFQSFYHSQGNSSLSDYAFFNELPNFVKTIVGGKKVDDELVEGSLRLTDEMIDFLKHNIKRKDDLNYTLFYFFNELKDIHDVDILKKNIQKVSSFY